ncbi:daptide-type RiPP biosynthesis dehydogenase [Streptacidiphilus sp. N1-3]|uniref:Daptide-type RiPP biosynthesis dehydogenase n=1 Tax=Streptacidiphilus alkalitolerans TaxID=3342712 RepID=A0ABV6WVQ8_9ACTN
MTANPARPAGTAEGRRTVVDRRTAVLPHDYPGLLARLALRTGGRTVVLLDPGVAGTEFAARIRAAVPASRRDADVLVWSRPGDLPGVQDMARQVGDADLVVAVGGGTVIDQAKLATLLDAHPAVAGRLAVTQRSGLVVLPSDAVRPMPLVAVPTTLGTGTEASAVACLAHTWGKRLVLGSVLTPESSVVDPLATASLPSALVAEGVLEALFRVVSPYIGDHSELPTEDALVEVIAQRLAVLGCQAGQADRSGVAVPAEVRVDVARLSGLTHAGWLHRGRDPYSVKGWLIANELSTVLGIRKIPAVATLLPALWTAVTAGEPRLGSAPRLARIWSRLRAAGPAELAALPADPGPGIAALIDHWRIGREAGADPELIDETALRVVRAWGSGLPMLGGLAAEDVRRLLTAALPQPVPPPTPVPAAQPGPASAPTLTTASWTTA